MSQSLEEILDEAPTEIKRAPPMPAGTYLAIVAKPHTTGKQNNEKQTPYVEFTFRLLSPTADVDQAKLTEIGGCAGKEMSRRFFLTEEAKWGLDEFLYNHLGFAFGPSRKQLLADAVNRQVLVVVKNQPSKDGSRMTGFIDSTLKA